MPLPEDPEVELAVDGTTSPDHNQEITFVPDIPLKLGPSNQNRNLNLHLTQRDSWKLAKMQRMIWLDQSPANPPTTKPNGLCKQWKVSICDILYSIILTYIDPFSWHWRVISQKGQTYDRPTYVDQHVKRVCCQNETGSHKKTGQRSAAVRSAGRWAEQTQIAINVSLRCLAVHEKRWCASLKINGGLHSSVHKVLIVPGPLLIILYEINYYIPKVVQYPIMWIHSTIIQLLSDAISR